jgi:hypothetical protein
MKQAQEHVYDESGTHWVAACPKCQAELAKIREQEENTERKVG